ncbi:uncharacterized protein DUF3159 [Nocardia tenerifensis]|uniref:Uncharacterized protein DUF3159 n=1 Tax=Nocardia tenerifensis TaxID=228006 RepID=A0A318K516_9NOCA|nr:DUF3159 domain-containing protein [Nocardia tenerifensis]PXX64024.1 uncharacterized protein DUF3159 [Nocardia tenerifensis]
MNSDDQRELLASSDVQRKRGAAGKIWEKLPAMHGPRHLDGAASAISFLIGYSVAGAEVGVFVAMLVAVVLGAVRLMRGDSVRAVAVLVILVFVEITAEGRGFYLPEVAWSVVMTVLFGATLLTGASLSFAVTREVRPAPGDPTGRLRAHRRVTFAWFLFRAVHVAVMAPLHVADKVVRDSFASNFGNPALARMLAPTRLWVRDEPIVRAGAA